jgi:secreted trypsin-like serine protease
MALWGVGRRSDRRFALIIAATAICAGTAMSQRAPAMVGGAPIAANDYGRSIVMILGSAGTACTATAIGRDLLLTAAHCVQPGSDYKLVASEPGQSPVLKAIAHIERHPQFEMQRLLDHLATADVALIKLAEPLASRITPARIGGETEPVSIGDTLVVAGYGVTVRGDGRTGGTPRAAALTVTGQPGSLQIRLFDPATKGVNAGLGACAGDSGAPAFRNAGSEARIIGVVSWSTGPNLTAGCGGLTGITPLARYRGWLVDTARRLGTVFAP